MIVTVKDRHGVPYDFLVEYEFQKDYDPLRGRTFYTVDIDHVEIVLGESLFPIDGIISDEMIQRIESAVETKLEEE